MIKAKFAAEHVHEQPAMPNAVGDELVAAHDPDTAKVHPFVSADLGSVGGGGDGSLRCQLLALAGSGEVDVHARVAIYRLR
jgi:hypothetical protein